MHLTVWNLTTQGAVVIQCPKDHANCVAFSPSGTYCAVAVRKECKVRILTAPPGCGTTAKANSSVGRIR